MSEIATVKTARSRQGASVPILEYDFNAGGKCIVLSATAQHHKLQQGNAYLIVATSNAFISLTKTNNASIGAGNDKSTFLAAGMPLHLAVGDDDVLSVKQVEDAGHIFVTRVLEK